MFALKKIISGGQTGVDQAALEVALSLGLSTGGWVPKGWRTEQGEGKCFHLRKLGLKESGFHGYRDRTLQNVLEGDATLLLTNGFWSPGTMLTGKLCRQHGKPHLLNPSAEELRSWLSLLGVETLNVGGSRESVWPEGPEKVRALLIEALGKESE